MKQFVGGAVPDDDVVQFDGSLLLKRCRPVPPAGACTKQISVVEGAKVLQFGLEFLGVQV